ncbi:MAG: long-chain fatty acid--CoA ligase [Bacteriovoracia bacterium]
MALIVEKTVSAVFLKRAQSTPNTLGFRYKPGTTWQDVTYGEFYTEAKQVSFGLMALGIQAQDKVVILSGTRFEWSICDMAILGAGAITVPIYPSSTPADIEYIVRDSEAKLLILENAAQFEKITQLLKKDAQALSQVKKIVVIEKAALASAESGLMDSSLGALATPMSLAELREFARAQMAKTPEAFDQNLRAAKPTDLITICYTSGTTGLPKGAMITQDNMVSVVEDVAAGIANYITPEKEVILSFLPFSHILGKVESMMTYSLGWTQCFAESMDKIPANMVEIQPTLMIAVPRIFEKAYTKILSMIDENGGIKKKLFYWALRVGEECVFPKHGAPSALTRAQYRLANQLVFSKIRARVGGQLRFCISGGAPLPPDIGRFFLIAGISILEGYGLTETTGPVAVNIPDSIRFGTVGRPMQDVSVRIAEEDGEILLKSRKIFTGYFKKPAETSQALQNGWFHTGDIGYVDQEGYIRITDRKKDLIVTSAGKNVAPQKIENIAKTHKIINQFVVYGDKRNYLTALVTLERDEIIKYAHEHHILFTDYSDLIRHEKIQALVQRIVDEVNDQLASYESIKKFTILPREFTVESGEITPSLKVKRKEITQKYAAELNNMYA